MKLVSSLFFFALFSFNAIAASIDKYFVVDIERIIYTCNASVDLKKRLDIIKDKYQKEINDKESALKKLDESLKNDQKTLTKEAFEKKVKDFQVKVSELQRNFQIKRSNLEEANQAALNKISEETSKIIEALAKEKKVEVVFPTSQILFASPELDMTNEVLDRVNKNVTKVELKIN